MVLAIFYLQYVHMYYVLLDVLFVNLSVSLSETRKAHLAVASDWEALVQPIIFWHN